MSMLCCCAGTSAQLSWQYGYSYDINNGIVPYSASTLQQQYQTPNFPGSACDHCRACWLCLLCDLISTG